MFPAEAWVEAVVSILQVSEGGEGYSWCRNGAGVSREANAMGKKAYVKQKSNRMLFKNPFKMELLKKGIPQSL